MNKFSIMAIFLVACGGSPFTSADPTTNDPPDSANGGIDSGVSVGTDGATSTSDSNVPPNVDSGSTHSPEAGDPETNDADSPKEAGMVNDANVAETGNNTQCCLSAATQYATCSFNPCDAGNNCCKDVYCALAAQCGGCSGPISCQ